MARKRDVVARTLPIVVALAFALATLNTSNQLSTLREEHGKLTQLHRIASNDLSKMMTNRGDCKQKLDELAEPWGAVVRYASNITYKNEVY